MSAARIVNRASKKSRGPAREARRDNFHHEVATAPLKTRIDAPTKPPAARRTAKQNSSLTVLTIGHSTRTIEEFVALLRAHGVTRIVDVRTVPRSRHNPQFNRDILPVSLKNAGIGYVHLAALGGLRRTTSDSVNVGWRNTSFRGYADYMQTSEFEQAVEKLIRLAKKDRLALMCAEAVPWRCHRSLIEDALLVRGVRGEDIMSLTRRQPHALTPFAKVKGTQLTYPAETSAHPVAKPSKKRARTAKTKHQHAD